VGIHGRGDDLVRHHPAGPSEVLSVERPAIADAPLGLRNRVRLLLGGRLVNVERAATEQGGREQENTQRSDRSSRHFSVSIRPLTNQRCITTTTATGGKRASVTVAITRFHSAVASPDGTTRLMPMTTVSIVSSVVTMSGQRYWFQPKMNKMTNSAAMFVRDRGARMDQKNRSAPAPSIRAASASSSGTVRKNCRNRNVAVADAISGMLSPA